VTDSPTIGACLDADRLNLWRVAKEPDPALLSTPYGRRPEVIRWARGLNAHDSILTSVAPCVPGRPCARRVPTRVPNLGDRFGWGQIRSAYAVLLSRRPFRYAPPGGAY
jgi:hypothetical protein